MFYTYYEHLTFINETFQIVSKLILWQIEYCSISPTPEEILDSHLIRRTHNTGWTRVTYYAIIGLRRRGPLANHTAMYSGQNVVKRVRATGILIVSRCSSDLCGKLPSVRSDSKCSSRMCSNADCQTTLAAGPCLNLELNLLFSDVHNAFRSWLCGRLALFEKLDWWEATELCGKHSHSCCYVAHGNV